MTMTSYLVFLSENDFLLEEILEVEAWESLARDFAASRIDR